MKRKLLIMVLIGTVFVINVSCSQDNNAENTILESNVKEIINDSLNLVFLTAEWCPASQSVLKNTYTKLCDSLSTEINVVIICASESGTRFKDYLENVGIKCNYYLLPNKQSHEMVIEHADRKRIRHFIKNNLKGYDDLELKWQFGVPVSLFVDKDLKIISTAPQEYENIKSFISNN